MADREHIEVTLPGVNAADVIIQLDFGARRKQIRAETFYQVAGQAQRMLFTAETVTRERIAAMAVQRQLQAASSSGGRSGGRRGGPRLTSQQRQQLKEREEMARLVVDQLTGLKPVYDALHEKGKIHFRVFALIDGHEIDLLRSQAAEPQAEDDQRPVGRWQTQ
jgi:hypothetical protein